MPAIACRHGVPPSVACASTFSVRTPRRAPTVRRRAVSPSPGRRSRDRSQRTLLKRTKPDDSASGKCDSACMRVRGPYTRLAGRLQRPAVSCVGSGAPHTTPCAISQHGAVSITFAEVIVAAAVWPRVKATRQRRDAAHQALRQRAIVRMRRAGGLRERASATRRRRTPLARPSRADEPGRERPAIAARAGRARASRAPRAALVLAGRRPRRARSARAPRSTPFAASSRSDAPPAEPACLGRGAGERLARSARRRRSPSSAARETVDRATARRIAVVARAAARSSRDAAVAVVEQPQGALPRQRRLGRGDARCERPRSRPCRPTRARGRATTSASVVRHSLAVDVRAAGAWSRARRRRMSVISGTSTYLLLEACSASRRSSAAVRRRSGRASAGVSSRSRTCALDVGRGCRGARAGSPWRPRGPDRGAPRRR